MDHLDDFEQLNELLQNIGDIEISSEGFSKEVILDFTEVVQNLDFDANDQLSKVIEETDASTLKKNMVRLAFAGTVESFRHLESMESQLPASLLEFHKISKIFGRMRLENELLGQNRGILITGLGGNSTHMRYYVALFAKTDTSIDARTVAQCRNEFEDLCLSYETQIETIEHGEHYILIKLLGSLNHNIHDLISEVLEAIPQLHSNYLVTNVERPSLDLLEQMAANPDAAYHDQESENSLPQSLLDHMHTLGIQLDTDDFELYDDDDDDDEFEDDEFEDDEYDDEYHDDEEDENDVIDSFEALLNRASQDVLFDTDPVSTGTSSEIDDDFLPDLAIEDGSSSDDSAPAVSVEQPPGSEVSADDNNNDLELLALDSDSWLNNTGRQALFPPLQKAETPHLDHDTTGDPTDEDIDPSAFNDPDIQPGPDSENEAPPGDNLKNS